ncbi:regulator of microtubule dynamics protein 1-like isoform X2 [Oculina patagonica]
MSELELDIKKADELFDNEKQQEMYDLLLSHKDSQNAEVEWRLARACRVLAEKNQDNADIKKKMTYEALEHAKLALSLDDKNFACHKWYAIALSIVGDYEGQKAKLQNAYVMKEHFEKAIELNPSDPTSRHLLGLWCFTFADMPWYTRKVAGALFATPPSSTYDEALAHFQKAEELEPNFFSKNHLLLGKTFLGQGKKEEAKLWLEKAVNNNPNKTVDDVNVLKEAKDLLRGL